MIRAGLLAATALVACAGPALAEPFAAPLPAGYQPSGQPLVKGIYAEMTGLGSIYDDSELASLQTGCQAQGKKVTFQGEEFREKGAVRIYRTKDAVAVIVDTSVLTTDPAICTASYRIDHDKTVRTGNWSMDEVPYFRNPEFGCDQFRYIHRCSNDKVAGIDATCLNDGDGFVGAVSCVSRRKDLSRGLELSYSSYVDDGSSPTGEWSLDKVVLKAQIDPAVFAP